MSGVRNAFTCSFVACRTGLRKCWQFIQCHRQDILSTYKQYQVLCLGLTGSGKSTLLAQLVGENTTNIGPTDGFNIKTLPINGIVLSIKELGGSERVQMFWTNYYNDKHALIFVVDISSEDSCLQQSIDTLRMILLNSSFQGRPCMIIGTHKDKPEARTQQQLEEHFRDVLLGHKWVLVCCSAFDRRAIQDAMSSLTSLMH